MRNLRTVSLFILLSLIPVLGVAAQDAAATIARSTLSEKAVQPQSVKDDRYLIGFQDVLDIQIYRHPDLSQRATVSPNGTISLFRLDQPIVAVCKTEGELAAELAVAYKEKFIKDPQVKVVVAEQKSQTVSVIGAVEKPGSQFITRRVHLLELLALAGGPNKEAGTRLWVARTGSTSNCKNPALDDDSAEVSVTAFKIRDVQEGKETFWIQPGDVVSVFEADVVYVYGNVNQQGALKIREPITLTQAIASAEGLKSAAKKDKIRILRQLPGGRDRAELVFDLNQIDKGKVKDPFLEPNDIVAVSEDKTKAILLGFANSIKNAVPNAALRFP